MSIILRMPITFENEDDIIVFALERILSFARRTDQIFVAQCIWWLASVVGLEQKLVTHIDNLHGRTIVNQEWSSKLAMKSCIPEIQEEIEIPLEKRDTQHQDKILKECKEYLKDSRRLRDIAALKAKGKTRSGRINPLAATKECLGITKMQRRFEHPNTAGIPIAEINRRKESGECLRCAWPKDRKGNHRAKDCKRPIKLDKGTANFPKTKGHQQLAARVEMVSESESSSESEDSSD
jgi:hypothetical protein